MTVARMATPRGPIPVTVYTFETLGGEVGGWECGVQAHINTSKALRL